MILGCERHNFTRKALFHSTNFGEGIDPYGSYYSNGNFFAWLGPNQGAGRIDFTGECATYLQVWVSSLYGLTAEGYWNGIPLASASVPSNLNTGEMERLRIDAPFGTCFTYVILHDTGNYWLIDDLSTDAGDVPNSRPPVIVVPGLMGSKLRNNDSCANTDEEIWVAVEKILDEDDYSNDSHLNHLLLAENGINAASDCDHIYEAGVVDSIPLFNLFEVDFYEPLIEYLDNTANFDVHVFAYDWRKDLTQTALLLDNEINSVLSSTGASQVNIVAHSLGGLLARYYVTSNPDRAMKVEQIISLGTPYLGAPKSLKTLRIGDSVVAFDELGTVGLLNSSTVKQIAQNFPAMYQTLPSFHYYNIYGAFFKLHSVPFNWEQTQALIQGDHNQSLTIAGEAFHTDAMDDWGSVSLPVAYRLIVGSGVENTPGVFHEIFATDWQTGKTIIKYDIIPTNGDGTVPLHSGDLQGNGHDYSGDATIWYAHDVDHLDLVKESYILEFVGAILSTPPSIPNFTHGDLDDSPNPPVESALYKGPKDTFDNYSLHGDTVPPTPPEMGDLPFEVNGGQIAAFGDVNLHVYDAAGNHTGLVEGEDRM
ncbi:MAG TPA: hypothetical protein VI451_21815 [Anaerolineales bacterium]|nr:hypothetical protein [Anaerolineales bacterium]